MNENALLEEFELTRKLVLDAKRAELLAWKNAKYRQDDDAAWVAYVDAHKIVGMMRASLADVERKLEA